MRVIFAIVIVVLCLVSNADIQIVDFDVSLGIENRPRYNMLFKHNDGKRNIDFFRNLWEKNIKKSDKLYNKEKIPRIIHQIWIGSKPLPDLYKKYQNTCKLQNSGWEYRMWTEEQLKKFPLKNKDLYEKASSYPEKADILRYEILKKFGGIYMDIDHICLEGFDQITNRYSFFAGLEPPLNYGKLVISNSLIGTYPNNQIFDKILYNIRRDWGNYNHLKKENIASYRSMLPLTDAFLEQHNLHHEAIIFPPTYFIPVFPRTSKSHYSFRDNMKILFGIYKDKSVFQSIRPESITYHDFYDD